MLSIYLSMVETEEEKSLVERLYNTYEQKMYYTAYSILQNVQDAEDAVHEAFIRIIKNVSAYDFDFSHKTGALVCTIVRRIALDKSAKNVKRQKKEVSFDEKSDAEAFPDTSDAEYGELAQIIGKMPLEEKEVLILRYVVGYTAEQTAKLLGISIQTLYHRRRKAIEILKENLL